MQKTRKEELLAEMTALTGGERNALDMLCTHEKIVNYIIRSTFDVSARRNLSGSLDLKDVYNFYKMKSELGELDLERELQDFYCDVRDYMIEKKILWEANRFETKLMIKLINFARSSDAHVILNRQLKAGKKRRWFEAIIVAQDFIMILKHHLPSHDVCITEDGILSWYDVYDDRMDQKDEYRWFEERKEMLQHILGPTDLDEKKYIYTIVWKTKYRFVNKSRRITCIPLGDLDVWLSSLETNGTNRELPLDPLVRKIKDAEVNDLPIPTCYPIIQSYAALRSAYEEGMKDSRK